MKRLNGLSRSDLFERIEVMDRNFWCLVVVVCLLFGAVILLLSIRTQELELCEQKVELLSEKLKGGR
jgi:hypothetical protein